MKLKTKKIWQHVHDSEQTADLLEAVAAQVAFMLNKNEMRAGIRAEISEFLAIEGNRPIGELLGGSEYQETLKANLIDTATPIMVEFAKTDEALAWLNG